LENIERERIAFLICVCKTVGTCLYTGVGIVKKKCGLKNTNLKIKTKNQVIKNKSNFGSI